MSQRDSGYERKANDLYETPSWVTRALIPHVPERINRVWEPAKGNGKMWAALSDARRFREVYGTDISDGRDFFEQENPDGYEAIITNPPYRAAAEFIRHALTLTNGKGFVAMLLRTDFDHAQSRRELFDPPFAKKVVLTKRIRWFEDSKGQPSFNHAWFIWDWTHEGAPMLAYAP